MAKVIDMNKCNESQARLISKIWEVACQDANTASFLAQEMEGFADLLAVNHLMQSNAMLVPRYGSDRLRVYNTKGEEIDTFGKARVDPRLNLEVVQAYLVDSNPNASKFIKKVTNVVSGLFMLGKINFGMYSFERLLEALGGIKGSVDIVISNTRLAILIIDDLRAINAFMNSAKIKMYQHFSIEQREDTFVLYLVL